jgi:lipoprotein-anchoring transpeptidase ErfK/SrfK
VPAPAITASVAEGAEVAPGGAVSLAVDGGRLASVVLHDDTADVLVADLDGASASATASVSTVTARMPAEPTDTRTWQSPPGLVPGHTLTLTAVATVSGGPSTTLTRRFTVAPPKKTLTTDVSPYGDDVVGVGYPVIVKFNNAVADKAAVERALSVETSKPIGPASWSWVSTKEIHFRPKSFWPADTSVVVHVNLAGVQAGPELWGMKNRDVTFSTGRAQVVTVNGKTHSMTVTRNGKVIRTAPVSLGRSSYPTRSGVKVIMTREVSHRMRSETVGITGDDAYDIVVPYALRITYSGEFLHGAPWNGNIGSANTSHGCTNLRLSDAKWLYNSSLIGDPVITTGTRLQAESRGNGIGADWNVGWAKWVAGSALA